MKVAWTEGLRTEDKIKVKEEFYASPGIRARLVKMLEKKIDAERKGLIARNNYDSPNWSLVQADSVGYQRAMQEVINLVT